MKILAGTDKIDVARLQKDMEGIYGVNDLWGEPQVSLTSLNADDDWFCSVGSFGAQYRKPERMYSQVNKSLEGTYIAELIREYKRYYRWRILLVNPGQTYTVHSDAYGDRINKRIHIPIITNEDCYFCYYSEKVGDSIEATVKHHHMPLGGVYEVNTSNLHCAVNYGQTARYHMVGVRYEK